MSKVDRDEFDSLVKPVIEWLAKNMHPHASIHITSTGAELVEGVIGLETDEFTTRNAGKPRRDTA